MTPAQNLDALVDVAMRQQANPSSATPSSLPDVFEALFTVSYTGPSTVHWHQGRIKSVEIPNPVTVKVR